MKFFRPLLKTVLLALMASGGLLAQTGHSIYATP